MTTQKKDSKTKRYAQNLKQDGRRATAVGNILKDGCERGPGSPADASKIIIRTLLEILDELETLNDRNLWIQKNKEEHKKEMKRIIEKNIKDEKKKEERTRRENKRIVEKEMKARLARERRIRGAVRNDERTIATPAPGRKEIYGNLKGWE